MSEVNTVEITNRSLYARIGALTWPIILQNLLSAAVTSADVVMLNFVGQAHISAVSLAGQYASVLFMVYYGLGTGATMLCSQYYGKGDLRAIAVVEGIALRFSLLISTLAALAAFTIPQHMMRLFTPDPELIAIGADYLRLMGVAYFCWGITEIYLAVLRSVGRVKIATVINTAAFTTNLFLNAVFIFMAMPAQLNDVSWSLAFSMYSVIIGQFLGSDMVAANSFVSQVRNLATVLCFSVASGGSILLGHLIGDNHMEEADRAAKAVMRLTILTSLIGSVLILLTMRPVLAFARLTDLGKKYLRVMLLINSYYVVGSAVNTTLIAGLFRAGGDSRFGMICDTIDMWCYAIPLGFLSAAVLKLPPLWVYFLLCTDEFVKWPWVIGHYRSRKWLKNITRDDLQLE